MIGDNVYHHPQKGPECRECKREYMRTYMRERRRGDLRTPQRRAR